jgi:hypothetical protein
MKKLLFIFSVVILIYSGCKSDDNPTTPSTGEVEMASVSFDSLSGLFGSGTISQTRNLSSSMLNFADRDSTRITFSYKGSSNGNDTLLYINDASNTRLYTLRDAAVTDSYRSINVTVPSVKVNAFFYYTITATSISSAIPYITIKDLKVYKK